MKCRKDCGACCIMPSISSSIPGMPDGKRAGQRCIHLTNDLKCLLFGRHDRPKVCAEFRPDPLVCGNSQTEALAIFAALEGIPFKPSDTPGE
jgi:Fe-S-cluster containining protein